MVYRILFLFSLVLEFSCFWVMYIDVEVCGMYIVLFLIIFKVKDTIFIVTVIVCRGNFSLVMFNLIKDGMGGLVWVNMMLLLLIFFCVKVLIGFWWLVLNVRILLFGRVLILYYSFLGGELLFISLRILLFIVLLFFLVILIIGFLGIKWNGWSFIDLILIGKVFLRICIFFFDLNFMLK